MNFRYSAFAIASLFLVLFTSESSISRSKAAQAGLREPAGRRDFLIGAAISMRPFYDDREYQEILKRDFNICVAENAFKMESLLPKKDAYDFKDADALVEFAHANGMKFRGHTLVWHKQLPEWLIKGDFSRDEVMNIFKDHIKTVVSRYKGRVLAWDVVNEAVADDGKGLRSDSFWHQKLGPDYIKLAFQLAREADPDAILYYNDFSNEDMNEKSNAVYNLLRNLKQQGSPIDGIGWQMHVDVNFKVRPEHRKNAQRLAELGLELSITELDIRMKLPATPELIDRQAAAYRDAANFCLTEPNCKSLVMWGLTDKHSWIPDLAPGDGAALIYDENYKPKPAYLSLKEVLQSATIGIPVISGATISGEDLIIKGANLERGATVFINWKRYKSEVDKQNPGDGLLVKKAGKQLALSKNAKFHILNPNGKLSTEFSQSF